MSSWSVEAGEAVKEASAAIKYLQRDNAQLRMQVMSLTKERDRLSMLLENIEQKLDDESTTLQDALAHHMSVAAERDSAFERLEDLEAAIKSMHGLVAHGMQGVHRLDLRPRKSARPHETAGDLAAKRQRGPLRASMWSRLRARTA